MDVYAIEKMQSQKLTLEELNQISEDLKHYNGEITSMFFEHKDALLEVSFTNNGVRKGKLIEATKSGIYFLEESGNLLFIPYTSIQFVKNVKHNVMSILKEKKEYYTQYQKYSGISDEY